MIYVTNCLSHRKRQAFSWAIFHVTSLRYDKLKATCTKCLIVVRSITMTPSQSRGNGLPKKAHFLLFLPNAVASSYHRRVHSTKTNGGIHSAYRLFFAVFISASLLLLSIGRLLNTKHSNFECAQMKKRSI